MADLKAYLDMGKEPGMEGKELRQFAEEERKRDEEQQREKRVHDRELKKMELEILEKSKINLDTSITATGVNINGPKLPSFNESRDKLDSYIERFERYAVARGWNSQDKAVYLSTLLQGKALDVYSRLSTEDASNYDKLKQALLKAYQLTEEGFRRKFYLAKLEGDESPAQYIFRMETYFDRWIEMSNIKPSYDELRQVILKEQYLNEVPKDLAIFLRERNPKTMTEILKLSESYMEARGWKRLEKKTHFTKSKDYNSNNSNNPSGQASNYVTKNKSFTDKRRNECFSCHKPGHMARNCPLNYKSASTCIEGTKNTSDHAVGTCITGQRSHLCSISNTTAYLKCGCSMPMLGSFCSKQSFNMSSLPITNGFVDNKPVKVMRDTGCNSVVIKRSLVSDKQMLGVNQSYVMIDRSVRRAPLARLFVQTPFYSGEIEALCLENPICDLIIGNIPNATMGPSVGNEVEVEVKDCVKNVHSDDDHNVTSVDENDRNANVSADVSAAVKTRSQTLNQGNKQQPLKVPDAIKHGVDVKGLTELQTTDETLKRIRVKCSNNMSYKTPHGNVQFAYSKGLMYRYFVSNKTGHRESKQLIVPEELRRDVLMLGHETLLSGDLGVGKTRNRILSQFYWPQISADLARFCQSCDQCQKTVPRGRVTKVPLQKMPLIDTPFQRVAVDIIGPIEPRSTSGNRYILTLVDFATRYPEAVPLPSIDTETVAEALVKMFSRISIPKEVLSDNGSQLTSKMMAEVARLLSIDQLFTTPYHAMCNGLCEKMNGTLKHMLRKMCLDNPKDWDRYVEPLLFAYREVPQDSTGFSPFELVYGRTVRGPMSVLRKLWTKESLNADIKTTYEYVFDLRNRLEEMINLAHANLLTSQTKYKMYYDRTSKARTLTPGSRVLVLLPTKLNKLLMQWRGPYCVTEKVGLCDYRIQMGSKVKIFQINMLKTYHDRDPPHEANMIGAIDPEPVHKEFDNEQLLEDYPSSNIETFKDVNVNPDLSPEQKCQLQNLIEQYSGIFSSKPGLTSLVEHDIVLTDHKPIHQKPYPIPHALLETVKCEIRDMLDIWIIEPAVSPYRFPLLMVKKKDGGCRPVIDFRILNKLPSLMRNRCPMLNTFMPKLVTVNFCPSLIFAKAIGKFR